MKDILYIENLFFTYPAASIPLFENFSLQLNQGWTAVIGPNGSGKTTLLKLICGILQPDAGIIRSSGPTYYTEQKMDDPPAGYAGFVDSVVKKAFKLKTSLGIADFSLLEWDRMSYGERKRCQIAAALFAEPAVLAIDEPSNHLDFRSRQVLIDTLRQFRGIGILVSHDRELMDLLCQHTIFLDQGSVDIRHCRYSVAAGERERENQESMNEFESARREVRKLKKKVIRQQEKTGRVEKQRSKRNISRKDHDAKAKKDLGRLTGKDAVEGRMLKRVKAKLEKARSREEAADYRRSYSLGITFNEVDSSRYFPLNVQSGYLKLGSEKSLEFPELYLQYGDKVGLYGNNGSGKSTFVNHLRNILQLPADRVFYIPQEIPEADSRSIMERIQGYDRETKGQIMILISRLGSDPHHLLETDNPSPGEVRKLLLAESILQNPGIIILDEPTNHMDLPSIECVENALLECPCTQLLVSHDRFFLGKTAAEYWYFSEKAVNEFYIDPCYSLNQI